MAEPISSRFTRPGRRRFPWWLVVLVLAGLVVTAFFGLRTVRAFRRMRQHHFEPIQTDVTQIKEWMTIPFIARMYRTPEDCLFKALKIPAVPNRYRTLTELELHYRIGQPGAILKEVQAVILDFQSKPPPP
jgi:hypothetical protein